MSLKDQFEALTKKAEIFYFEGEISNAHKLFLESEKVALDLANDELIADAKKNVGRTFHRLGEYKNAEKYYLEAIEILENQKIIESLPAYLNHLASNYMKQYNFEDCFSTLQKALQIANQIDDIYSIGKIKNTLGVYYEYLGDLDTAINLYQEALKIFNDLKKELALAKTYNLLSSVKRKLGDFTYASDILEKARIIAQNNKDITNLSHSLINKVDILFEKGDYRGIRRIKDQILQLEDKIENYELQSVIKRILGKVYQNEGKFKESLEYYKNALKIARKINYNDGIAKAYKNMGLLYLELKESLSAYRSFSKSIKTFREISESISDSTLRKLYAKSYEEVPDILKKIEIILETKSYEINDEELNSTLDDAKTVCKTIQEKKINENISNECRNNTSRLFQKDKSIKEKRENIFLEWCERLSEECFIKLTEDTRNYLILYRQVLLDSPWDPIRTDKPILKDKLNEALNVIAATIAKAPVKMGDVLIENILGLGANVIASRDLLKHENT